MCETYVKSDSNYLQQFGAYSKKENRELFWSQTESSPKAFRIKALARLYPFDTISAVIDSIALKI